jgi:hypothetical protein
MLVVAVISVALETAPSRASPTQPVVFRAFMYNTASCGSELAREGDRASKKKRGPGAALLFTEKLY